MKNEEYLRLKKLFVFGIVASLVTVFLGEIPIGWVVNPEADNEILSMFFGYASLSLPQLACGVFFGGIGIPLQYYGYKAIAEIPQNIIDFTLWLVLPFSAVFMMIYTVMTIAMAIPIVKGKTIFPKWAVVFNPLVAKLIIPIIATILPNTKIVNGLNMADMGIGSLITFVGLLILLEKHQRGKCNFQWYREKNL